MKCRNLFPGKNETIGINMSSAESSHRVIKIDIIYQDRWKPLKMTLNFY